MVVYYREHLKEFTTPARAQWEELMVRYSKYPTKAAAFEAIARMGNQVFGGVPFAQVAKAGSDGVTAADGGRRDWTTKGSLDLQGTRSRPCSACRWANSARSSQGPPATTSSA